MRTLLATIAILSAFPCLAQEPTSRTNALEKLHDVPHKELSPESRGRAVEFFRTITAAFAVLGNGGLEDSDGLAEFYTTRLLPQIQPLKDGTPAEKKVFLAGETIYKTLQYISANSKNPNAAWDNKEFNTLLRLKGKPSDVAALSEGIGEMLWDFYQMVDPEGFAKLPKKTAETKPSPQPKP